MSEPPFLHQMLVHLFGATSSPCCAAFALCQTAYEFGNAFHPEISDIVLNNFYVDNCQCSVSTEDDGIRIVNQLLRLLLGGFRLTKWITNSHKVSATIAKEELSSAAIYELDSDCVKRVLGMHWSVQTDQFQFEIKLPDKPYSRRNLLSALSSLYNTLGFLKPVILQPNYSSNHSVNRALCGIVKFLSLT